MYMNEVFCIFINFIIEYIFRYKNISYNYVNLIVIDK